MREQRKVVTILFADVVGSTELASQRDPEVVRSMMSRYFKRIVEIASAYGGTVEKFAGDAAMIVFGVPAVHDDDAERAVRAALEIRDGAIELEVRVGVSTGEAVTAAAEDRQFMVSGDTVNVAARLQQGADAGEVLVGDLTHQLTRAVVDYEPHEPVVAKGKARPLTAFRALKARSTIPTQARGVPGLRADLVGRARELRIMLDTYARTADDRTAHLFTVVGAPGIGKSRLIAEALDRLAGTGARVLHGRCLPYGRGVTYWPLIEMVRQDTGITLADDAPSAVRKLDRWLGELMAADVQRPAVQTRLAVMLGYESAESVMPDTPGDRVEKEIAWAIRKYLEAVARSAPLIVVVDDVQWAEPPVLALIELLAERITDVPVFIVCLARPEFFDAAGGWKGAKPNSTTITLDPLSAQETATLMSRLLEIEALPEPLRRQIIERSAGTPLFCEEFIHMLIDEGVLVREASTWRAAESITTIQVPHEINAVLSARLDLLTEDERQLLQAASVVGQRFAIEQVQALMGGGDVEQGLESLRRKGLVSGGDGAGEDYEFRHLLIRDAAYSSLPKSGRASLHDHFRRVLEGSGDTDLIVEILAYHAERALTMSRELALDPVVINERADGAVHWLLAVAERARTRHDTKTLEAALNALIDASGAMARRTNDLPARIRLLEAQLAMIKGDYANARQLAGDAADLAEQAGLLSAVAKARLVEAWIANWTFDEASDYQGTMDRAVEACERAGELGGEIEARHVRSFGDWGAGNVSRFISVNEELAERARSAGDVAHLAMVTARLVAADRIQGSDEAARRHRQEATELAAKHGFRNVALRVLMDTAGDAMDRGDFAHAEALWRELAASAEDAGAKQYEISAYRFLGNTLLHADRPQEAAGVLDHALELSLATGERWNRSELFGMRARAALDSGDPGAADRFIEMALASLRSGDMTAISEVHVQLGAIRSAQDRDDEAETALRRAVDVIAPTEFINVGVEAGLCLAIFLAQQGQSSEAAEVFDRYAPVVKSRGWHIWDGLIERYEEETRRHSSVS